jgi:DNA-directed RNA polymerase specialized sigma24 family protein
VRSVLNEPSGETAGGPHAGLTPPQDAVAAVARALGIEADWFRGVSRNVEVEGDDSVGGTEIRAASAPSVRRVDTSNVDVDVHVYVYVHVYVHVHGTNPAVTHEFPRYGAGNNLTQATLSEEGKTVDDALERILPEHRALLRTVYFEGKTLSEVARVRGVCVSSVWRQVSRALGELRRALPQSFREAQRARTRLSDSVST